MKYHHHSETRRQLLLMGAAAAAAPAAVFAAGEPAVQVSGGKTVVSGRVVCAQDGRALAGAVIEIWPADARGVRDDAALETAVADGDGRYFAVLKGGAQRLHYRVSHKDYTTRATQLHVASARQREATLTR
jgi:hypothetical protein